MSKLQPGPRKRPARDNGNTPPGTWRGCVRLWIDVSRRGAVGPGKLRLLEAIAATRSLSAAAKRLRMSYRLAWKHLQLIEQRTGLTVVERQRGGKHGGGTDLTSDGRALLEAYQSWRDEMEGHMQAAFHRHFAPWTRTDRGRT